MRSVIEDGSSHPWSSAYVITRTVDGFVDVPRCLVKIQQPELPADPTSIIS